VIDRGSSNGRTADFESANLGSSPSPRSIHQGVLPHLSKTNYETLSNRYFRSRRCEILFTIVFGASGGASA
jgi:hypothetical protein